MAFVLQPITLRVLRVSFVAFVSISSSQYLFLKSFSATKRTKDHDGHKENFHLKSGILNWKYLTFRTKTMRLKPFHPSLQFSQLKLTVMDIVCAQAAQNNSIQKRNCLPLASASGIN